MESSALGVSQRPAVQSKTHCVLPFSFDPEQNCFVVLLGEPRLSGASSHKEWTDFGGHPANVRETPVQTATRCAFDASNGLLGTKKQIQASMSTKMRTLVAEQGYTYLLPVRSDIASLLPSQHASNTRCILGKFPKKGFTLNSSLMPFKQIRWFPLSHDLEFVPHGLKGKAKLNAQTRNAIRYALTHFVFDKDEKDVSRKTFEPDVHPPPPCTGMDSDENEIIE